MQGLYRFCSVLYMVTGVFFFFFAQHHPFIGGLVFFFKWMPRNAANFQLKTFTPFHFCHGKFRSMPNAN